MSSASFTITSTARNNQGTATEQLVLTLTPPATTVGTTSVASPYVMPYTIANPSAAQISKYVQGATITLTSDT